MSRHLKHWHLWVPELGMRHQVCGNVHSHPGPQSLCDLDLPCRKLQLCKPRQYAHMLDSFKTGLAHSVLSSQHQLSPGLCMHVSFPLSNKHPSCVHIHSCGVLQMSCLWFPCLTSCCLTFNNRDETGPRKRISGPELSPSNDRHLREQHISGP